eukprot:326356-Prorocentrum_minimum.AAC.1
MLGEKITREYTYHTIDIDREEIHSALASGQLVSDGERANELVPAASERRSIAKRHLSSVDKLLVANSGQPTLEAATLTQSASSERSQLCVVSIGTAIHVEQAVGVNQTA